MKKLLGFFLIFYLLSNVDFRVSAQEIKTPKNLCGPVFPSDNQIEWECYKIKNKETPETVFGDYWESVLRFNRIDRRHVWPGKYLKIPKNLDDAINFTPMPKTLDKTKDYSKYILINLDEQFLGAYESGELKFSMPIASGKKGHLTPKGFFKVLGGDKNHRSSLYKIEKTNIPYPMFWAIKFYVSKNDVAFWLHGRDLPGRPASHGCVGLYDEDMQKKYYGFPNEPELNDAKKLYLWIFPDAEFDEKPFDLPKDAPIIPVEII